MTLNIKSRRLPRGGLYESKKSIKCIEKEFGKAWLEGNNGHPLKDLWMDKSVFASIQLHQFGYSLGKLKNLNPRWFTDIIDKVKNGTPGIRRGAVLEVFIASQLHCPPREVELPRPNNPGYDIKLKLSDNSYVYYQVKNNSFSQLYDEIKEKARSIEENLVQILGARAVWIVVKTDKDPNDGDWWQLREQLPSLFIESSSNETIFKEIEGGWHIEIYNVSNNNLHQSKGSYVFQLITPILDKEKNGIYRDVIDACEDLEKKEDPDRNETINIAVICIPLDLPFAQGGMWVNDYFAEFPKSRASGVLLYKPGVVWDLKKKENRFTHTFHLILKSGKEDWIETFKAPNSLDIAVGSGTISIEGESNWDNFNLLYGGSRRERYLGHHVYQSGNINYFIRDLGKFEFQPQFNINTQLFFIDSDRKEKEYLLDTPRDQDLVLLR